MRISYCIQTHIQSYYRAEETKKSCPRAALFITIEYKLLNNLYLLGYNSGGSYNTQEVNTIGQSRSI